MRLSTFWRGLPRATKATLLRIPVGLLACVLVLLVARGILTLSWYLVLPLVGMHALNGWTDFMDGRWARKDQDTGPIGEALDHIADKLGNDATFVACALAGWVPGEIACLLVIRDFLSSGLREGRYATNELGNGGTKRSLSGAIKTWGVFLLLGAAPLNAIIAQEWSQTILNGMLIAFVFVLIWSTFTYLWRHGPKIAPHMQRFSTALEAASSETTGRAPLLGVGDDEGGSGYIPPPPSPRPPEGQPSTPHPARAVAPATSSTGADTAPAGAMPPPDTATMQKV